MSTDVYSEIMAAFDQQGLENLERQLGVEGQKAREATGAAVGTILEGLRRKAEQARQQPEAHGGLEDILAKIGLGEKAEAPAEAPTPQPVDEKGVEDIFGDIFGHQGKQDVERRFSKTIQIDPATMKKIFGAVLPIVLGALAKARQAAPEAEKGGGGFSLDDILGKATQDFQKRAQPQQKGGGGLLEAILDKDHDGDVDLGDLAGAIFGR